MCMLWLVRMPCRVSPLNEGRASSLLSLIFVVFRFVLFVVGVCWFVLFVVIALFCFDRMLFVVVWLSCCF